VVDVVEVLDGELAKSPPDVSKIKRWSTRLLEIAERVGIGVATAGLTHILFVG
jgi:hypothetical protein